MFSKETILIHVLVNLLILSMALLPDLILVVFRNHRRLAFLQTQSRINES
jgi:hypothetical protein